VPHCKARWELYDRIKAGQIGEIPHDADLSPAGTRGVAGPREGNANELLWQIRNYLGFFWPVAAVPGVVAHNVDEAAG